MSSLGGFFVKIHQRVSRAVLGPKLVEKADAARRAAQKRQEKLDGLCREVEGTTHKLKRELGLVENGAH